MCVCLCLCLCLCVYVHACVCLVFRELQDNLIRSHSAGNSSTSVLCLEDYCQLEKIIVVLHVFAFGHLCLYVCGYICMCVRALLCLYACVCMCVYRCG